MVKEINSVAEAVPVIMEARGWLRADRLYYKGAKDTRGRRYLKYSTPERTLADCLSLDVLAKEVWLPKHLFGRVFGTPVSGFAEVAPFEERRNIVEAKDVFEAACIATARALVALAATTGSQEEK